jgi:alpha-mannosidase
VHDDRSLVEARIRTLMAERITPALHAPGVAFEVSAYAPAGEPVPFEEAAGAEYTPFAVGGRFGAPWSTTWFRLRGSVPGEWAGRAVDAVVEFSAGPLPGFSAEALVYRDGSPLQGLHREHRRIPVGRPAVGGEPVDLVVEAAANPDLVMSFAPTPMGDPATAPATELYVLTRAEIAPFNEEVWHLFLDLQVLTGLMVLLPLDDGRRAQIRRAVERALDELDPADVAGCAASARDLLRPLLEQPAYASAHRVSAIGHAHLDTAWLWPIRETRRKVTRTFANVVQLMDEYPEYRFGASQAQHYDWLRREQPDLYERVRDRVREGRIVPLGGMWVEADANLPAGESLARQFLYGKRFFADELGVEPREAWIPDVFGYPASLPQIFRQAGCPYFVTQKMSWNDTNRFPHHTFQWEGIDGTRVLTHFPPADTYNGSMLPHELVGGARKFLEHGRAELSLYPFGHGDGGGGPTREMLELARRQRDLESVPRVAIESPADFFDRVEREDPDPPVWVGELYFEKHRGTYTSQARTKAGNRRGEWLLREVELWATEAARWGASYPAAEIDALWCDLLLHQFHDILPGSGIAWVHHDAETAHARIAAEAERLVLDALGRVSAGFGGGHAVANALTHARAEVVAAEVETVPGDGPVQELADGRRAFYAAVPGLGVAPARALRAPDVVAGSERHLENGLLRVEIADDGTLASVVDKTEGREVLAPGEPGNLLVLHPDDPMEFDAWDVDRSAFDRSTPLRRAEVVRLVEAGPLVAAVRVVRAFGASRIVQEYVLRAGSKRLDIVTEIDWHEDEQLLAALFPVDVRASRARYEIQFGAVDRPTHRNTTWDWAQFEVCAHSWADLAEPGFGVALLNDAKYGHEVRGNVMRITLLRAARYPDPQADRGHHGFTYALLPHTAADGPTAVVEAAHALNLPVRVVAVGPDEAADGDHDADRAPLLEVEGRGIVVSAVKHAADGSGDLVVRVYEPIGARARAALRFGVPVASAHRCDLLERPERDVAVGDRTVAVELRPFEIATIRIVVEEGAQS